MQQIREERFYQCQREKSKVEQKKNKQPRAGAVLLSQECKENYTCVRIKCVCVSIYTSPAGGRRDVCPAVSQQVKSEEHRNTVSSFSYESCS